VTAWNDPDPDSRRPELERLYAGNGHIVTQGGVYAGIDAIVRHVAEVHEEFIAPGHYGFASGGAVGHHDCILFRWEMRQTASGEVADAGMNLIMVSAAGLIAGGYQFALGGDSSIGTAGQLALRTLPDTPHEH
jgi:hypothetical protein